MNPTTDLLAELRWTARETRRVQRKQLELETAQDATAEALRLLGVELAGLGVKWANTLGDLANSIIESVEEEESCT